MKASNPSMKATLHQPFKVISRSKARKMRIRWVVVGRIGSPFRTLSQLRLVAIMLRFVHPFKHFVVVAIHPQRAIGFLRPFILPLDI